MCEARTGSGRGGESPLRPPVGTRRAQFTHRAPQNRSVTRRVGWLHPGLRHSWWWELEPRLLVQRCPVAAPLRFLTSTSQRPPPDLLDAPAHAAQRGRAHAQSKILVVAVEHLRQVRLLRAHRLVLVRGRPRLGFAHKALARFHARLAVDQDGPASGLPQVMDETKEGKGRRLLGRSASPLQQVPVEAQHCRLLRRDAQPEGGESLLHLLAKPFSIAVVLEHGYKFVSEPRELGVASAALPETSFEPQVQHVMQIEVCQHGADRATLRYPVIQSGDYSVLHHAGFEPFVQEPDKPTVVDPMSYELSQPFVIDRIEVARQIRFRHVARPVLPHPLTKAMQGRMRAARWAEPVRAVQEVLLEHCAEYPRHRLLHRPVFDRADADGAALFRFLWGCIPAESPAPGSVQLSVSRAHPSDSGPGSLRSPRSFVHR